MTEFEPTGLYFEDFEKFSSRVDAMRREAQLKKWSKIKKEAIIAGDLSLLKKV